MTQTKLKEGSKQATFGTKYPLGRFDYRIHKAFSRPKKNMGLAPSLVAPSHLGLAGIVEGRQILHGKIPTHTRWSRIRETQWSSELKRCWVWRLWT